MGKVQCYETKVNYFTRSKGNLAVGNPKKDLIVLPKNRDNLIITTMEEFRKSLYAACRQMNLEIVPKDIGARVMAFVGLAGGDERICYSPRLRCELEHLQELYHIQGGDVPDKDFVERIQIYTKELQEYTDKHNGEWPEWLNNLISNRYGFKPYKL